MPEKSERTFFYERKLKCDNACLHGKATSLEIKRKRQIHTHKRKQAYYKLTR